MADEAFLGGAGRMNGLHSWVPGFLTETAGRTPERAALFDAGRSTSFAELDRNSDAVAAELQSRGVNKGDRVVLLMDNSIELVTAIFGVLKAGAVIVVLHATTKHDKLAFLIEDCGAAAVITQASLIAVVEAAAGQTKTVRAWMVSGGAPPQGFVSLEATLGAPPRSVRDPVLAGSDLAAIIYTSGSTGDPKGVMLSHGNLASTSRSIASYLENVPDDVVMCVLPLAFGYGLSQVLTGALVGFSLVLEKSFAFRAEVLKHMVERRVTGLPGVPGMFASLVQMGAFNGSDLPALRYMTNAAAAIAPAHILRLRDLFPKARFFSMYGQTECTRVCYLDPARIGDKTSSVGKAIPGCEAYVIDELGRRVGPGVVGELVVRGANVMQGYWRRPEETAKRLRDGEIPGERVLHTGDYFKTDEEGLLYFVGRSDDVFKCRGEKVSPKEIEHVLCELAGVAEVAVAGVDDPIDGKAVKAFVVLQAGAAVSEGEIRRHCRERLESHLVPKVVEIRDSLPKTDSGKIKKLGLVQPPQSGA